MRRLSLRTRLVVGVCVLAAVGLVAADAATYTELRSFLVSRVDTTLNDAHHAFDQGAGGLGGLPPGVFVSELRSSDGRQVLAQPRMDPRQRSLLSSRARIDVRDRAQRVPKPSRHLGYPPEMDLPPIMDRYP